MPPETFTQIYSVQRPGLFESGQHVRGPAPAEFAEWRKYALGAEAVRNSLYHEYPDVAEAVLARVSEKVHRKTGRDLRVEMTRGDLDLIHKELNRKPKTFKQFYETYRPGPFGIGQGDYVRTKDAGPGRARRDGAQLIWQAIARDYGPDRAKDVFAQVSRTRPKINEEMTRGDLDLIHKELNRPTTFTKIYNTLRPGLFESGQHVRGGEKDGHEVYYTHDPLVPSGRGSEAQKRREDKYARGAAIVEKALNNEYHPDVVKTVLARVSKRTGRDLYKEVTRGDLDLIHKELNRKPTTFSDILKNFASVRDEKPNEPVRGKITKDAKAVYLHYQGLLDACWPEDQEWRDKRHKDGATLVKQAIIAEYGKEVANEALAVVSRHVGHDLGKKMTLADLKRLEEELPRQQQRYQERHQAMEQRYQELQDAIESRGSPRAMFEAFERFTAGVDARRKDRFRTVVELPDDDGRWALAFKIGNTEVYRSERLQDGPGQYRIEFALRLAVQDNLPDPTALLDLQTYVASNVQSMSDDPGQRTWITNNLDNPVYARTNFQGIEEVDDDPNLFRAVFLGADGKIVKLELSNRMSTMGEMSGETLRNALKNGEYENLRDIAARGHQSKDDHLLKRAITNMWENVAGAMGFENGAALTDHLARLPDGERNAIADILRGLEDLDLLAAPS